MLFENFHEMFLGLQCEKSRAMYDRINNLMEKLSKIAYFAIFGVSIPGFVIPKAILSYIKYYTTNLGGDAFDLSIPMWYVHCTHV